MHFFDSIEQAPLDPIFGLNTRFQNDPRPQKVDLGAGVYKTEELKPLILESVKQAEALLLERETSKDYLPIDGLSEYISLTKQLVFGREEQKIYGAQTVGGTAALRVGGAFLKERGLHKIYLSNPTWANHHRIFEHIGLEIVWYDYLTSDQSKFNFENFIQRLKEMESGSIVLLHACCHNPTGLDPTIDQWQQICDIIQQRALFPFFDLSYQGFGQDLIEDSAPLRLFLDHGLTFAVAISYSKNFGLYAERCGALCIVCREAQEASYVGSHIKPIIRGLYSNPPCHGARIISTILGKMQLRHVWEQELASMRHRLLEMREALVGLLEAKNDHFKFLIDQKGMFSYTGLSESEVARLIEDYGIYLPNDGRINIAGLNHNNLQYVAEAINRVNFFKK